MTNDIDAAVGQRVHQLLWTRRIPQSQVCRVIGVNEATMSRRLRGESKWTLRELDAIADYLAVSWAELLPRLDSNQEPAGKTRGAVTCLDTYRSVRRASLCTLPPRGTLGLAA